MHAKLIERVEFVTPRIRDNCCIIANKSAHAMNVVTAIYNSIQSDVNENDGFMLSCTIDRQMCGFITGCLKYDDCSQYAEQIPTTAKIDWFYVDKRFQRRGIGRELIAEYVDYVASLGVREIEVFAEPVASALNFYKKNGFVPIEQSRNFLKKALEARLIQK